MKGGSISKMTEYSVSWEIMLEATCPEDAAREALKIQRDPNSLALCFVVCNADMCEFIDLLEEENEYEKMS
uniref:Uncharacterized protein n=2 Tax=viral metagenome TaxID=1070528 RepID=A0A6M3JRB1_9ZZZZ